MNKLIGYVLLFVLFAPLCAMAGWIDPGGKPLPDAPDRKSIGGIGAWLVLTSNESETFSRWDTPSETASINSTKKIERWQLLTALIFFRGCGVDKNGNCNLAVKFKLIQPDGKVYADLPDQEAWIGKPAPAASRVGMSVGYMRVIIEPGEPLGKYTVRAIVRDKNLNTTFNLSSGFEVVERNSLRNALQNNNAP